ncbi:hypothetical protein [Neobacillus niacini]|uniref:hypothetical protein n=1 Tax=Neobacillus niacini TaxID=86668 RepID=UPI002859E133|nr:hypothetical protein [Neobacillus niacini]MDR6999090.1 biopolymer transport protein ExbD [Neobacillus niacini]
MEKAVFLFGEFDMFKREAKTMGISLNPKILIGVVILVLFVIAALFLLQHKEPFPVNSISTSEAIDKLEQSKDDIVLVTTHNNKNWYLTLNDKGKGQEKFIETIESQGWKFDEQEGSGLFFSNESGKRIGGCKIWNRKYLVCHN